MLPPVAESTVRVVATILALVTLTGCANSASIPQPAQPTTHLAPARQPDPSATPRRPTPVSPAPPRPAPSPSRASAPGGPNLSLEHNTVYRLDLDNRVVACSLKVRSPRPPLRNSELAHYLRTVVACLLEAFKKPLADQGFTLTTPKVKTYRKSVKTPCGTYGQHTAPAYYCSVDQTIYWPQTSDDGRQAYTFARLGYVGLLAHEFGHHLQNTTGMLNDYAASYFGTRNKTTRNLLSRRLELQAQCFEGVFLATTARSLHLSAADRTQLRTWHSYTGDEDPPEDRRPDHGTSAAQVRWLDRGIDTADFGRCNTWKATRLQVR